MILLWSTLMNNYLNTIHTTMCEKVIIMRVGLRSGSWGCAGSAESDTLGSFNNASFLLSYNNINARINTRTIVPPTLVTLTLSVLSTRTRWQTPSLLMYICALGNVPDLLAYFEE